MGLSRLLLIVAVAAAVGPLVANRLRPPSSIRELEKSFVVGVAVTGIGALVASQLHGLDVFGAAHLVYLLAVVSAPMLLIGWWISAFVRRRRTLPIRIGALAGLMLALLGVWATHIEPNWLQTDTVAMTGPVTESLTIGVLADLQTPNISQHEWNAIDTLIAAAPDIVLVPGDLFQGHPATIAAAQSDFVELLAALTANVEVVAVVSGDSDRPDELVPIVEAAGALYIDNQVTEFTVKGQAVRLAGVTVFPARSKVEVLAELGESTDAFTILLSHRPDIVFDLPLGSDVDLIVSGHTHGGQVALPFIGPPITLSAVPRSIASGGIGVVDNFVVYVSAGVGLERGAAPQLRLGVRPSVGIVHVLPDA